MTFYTVTSTLVLLASGRLTGAESSSWALMQPVVARLEATPQIQMQQGMLHTFGRVMRILLQLTSILIVVTAVFAPDAAGAGFGDRHAHRPRADRLHLDRQRANQ